MKSILASMRGWECNPYNVMLQVTPNSAGAFSATCFPQPITLHWPRGLMDKALVFRTKDCRFESCRGHLALYPCTTNCHPSYAAPA